MNFTTRFLSKDGKFLVDSHPAPWPLKTEGLSEARFLYRYSVETGDLESVRLEVPTRSEFDTDNDLEYLDFLKLFVPFMVIVLGVFLHIEDSWYMGVAKFYAMGTFYTFSKMFLGSCWCCFNWILAFKTSLMWPVSIVKDTKRMFKNFVLEEYFGETENDYVELTPDEDKLLLPSDVFDTVKSLNNRVVFDTKILDMLNDGDAVVEISPGNLPTIIDPDGTDLSLMRPRRSASAQLSGSESESSESS